MAMNYMDENAVCPFYMEGGDCNRIRCEGFAQGTRLHISFDCKDRMKAHAKKYCNDMAAFATCPLYGVIMKQYEEKEK
jgi:hypothetical protein